MGINKGCSWGRLERSAKRKRKRRAEASTSKSQPQCERVHLPDGRIIYRLWRYAGAKYPQQKAPKPEERVLQPSCLTVSETDVPESANTAEATTADPKISAKEELKVINLSSDPNVHRPVSISASLSVEERMHLVELLKEYQDVFAW